jgi:hypothetical protein
MSGVTTEVGAFEHGRLRLFAVDTSAGEAAALVETLKSDAPEDAALTRALGARQAEAYWVDLVRLADVAEMGLGGYLRRAYEVPEAALEGADLGTSRSHVLIVPSKALGDAEQTLSPQPWLAPLAEFDVGREDASLQPMDPVGVRSREASDPAPEPAPKARGGPALKPGAILVLVLIAAAFIALVAL